MSIRFTKMHGLGNDFMVIDAVRQSIKFSPSDIKALARRDTGIGFDQCLLIEKSAQPEIDFFYRIYNADGSEVAQCGNGARCLARFIQHHGLSGKKTLTVATKTTQMSLQLNDDSTVTVAMGPPQFKNTASQLTIGGQTIQFYEVDLGNPHAVIQTHSLQTAPVNTEGRELSTHPFFPHQCNIEYMQILSRSHIQLRVYERGCGETQACGSGAVAAMAIGARHYDLADTVTVSLPGGDLQVSWIGQEGPLLLTGGAVFVYEGVLF